MKPVVTPAEMAAADRRAIAAGTAEAVLIARAGGAVARRALALLGGAYGRRVVVVAGKGNNGADGVVAGERLARLGVGVAILRLADGIDRVGATRELERADLAIDAMFGTGFRGSLDGDAAWVAAAFARAAVPVLAVDIPSGVDGTTGAAAGPAVRADATVCFAALKPGLLFEPGRTLAGAVHVADIGLDPGPTRLHVLEPDDLALPTRAAAAHKWSAGLLVIGGSTGMVGAPLMAAHAGARCGAGMVVCALPGHEAAARASGSEIVVRALPATAAATLAADAAEEVLKDVDRFAAVAIGPGLGRDEPTQQAVRRLVAEITQPVVVDADALNALAADPAPLHARVASQLPPAIVTPHAGEYARLAGAPLGTDRVDAARALADRLGAIVVVKGPGTVVAAPGGDAVVNRTDSAALATAGTGDVLTGIIGGLLASGATPFAAAATGVYVHGCAAQEAATGADLVAMDLIAALHPTLESLRAGRRDRPDGEER